MIMTASTLYEAVEPNVIWKQLLATSVSEITGDGNGYEVCKDSLCDTIYVHTVFLGNSHDPVHSEDL